LTWNARKNNFFSKKFTRRWDWGCVIIWERFFFQCNKNKRDLISVCKSVQVMCYSVTLIVCGCGGGWGLGARFMWQCFVGLDLQVFSPNSLIRWVQKKIQHCLLMDYARKEQKCLFGNQGVVLKQKGIVSMDEIIFYIIKLDWKKRVSPLNNFIFHPNKRGQTSFCFDDSSLFYLLPSV